MCAVNSGRRGAKGCQSRCKRRCAIFSVCVCVCIGQLKRRKFCGGRSPNSVCVCAVVVERAIMLIIIRIRCSVRVGVNVCVCVFEIRVNHNHKCLFIDFDAPLQ